MLRYCDTLMQFSNFNPLIGNHPSNSYCDIAQLQWNCSKYCFSVAIAINSYELPLQFFNWSSNLQLPLGKLNSSNKLLLATLEINDVDWNWKLPICNFVEHCDYNNIRLVRQQHSGRVFAWHLSGQRSNPLLSLHFSLGKRNSAAILPLSKSLRLI